MTNKEKLLQKARKHIALTRDYIAQAGEDLARLAGRSKEDLRRMSGIDRLIGAKLLDYRERRKEELKSLYSSPYFTRCDVRYDNAEADETLYFAKFPLTEKSIYSWVAAAAAIRFEDPGAFAFSSPDGKTRRGTLLRKDQFMIVGGKIVFMSTEAQGAPRELVYQDYFSAKKSGFALQEITSKMEKLQDQVIRADHKGSFAISGPAGSGKTTLALHRVAYLAQSPDLAAIYKPEKMIVFVQDAGTKQYFSQLLPELGINGVTITTFYEWACGILGCDDFSFAIRPGRDETEKDNYEISKITAIRSSAIPSFSGGYFNFLRSIYTPYFSSGQMNLFKNQEKEKKFDRFDLTILLAAGAKRSGRLEIESDYYLELKNGNYKKMKGKFPLEYSLILIDEFQNYLPEQLSLIKSCLEKNKSVLYVGDLAQQIYFGTIRNWQEIGDVAVADRQVVLQKVYRNTKSILKYTRDLGYPIDIPNEIKEGVAVAEKRCSDKKEELDYINNLIGQSPERSIGILAKDAEYLTEFKKEFGALPNLHIMAISEAQGIEFDVVCLVGIEPDLFAADKSNAYYEEKKKIQKDLLYVALTRAIDELHVLGKCGLLSTGL